MSNFDINVDRRTDKRTDGRTNGKADAYVAKSGGQRDVSCKVGWLFSLVVENNTNFDINVELRHNRTVDRRTDGRTDRRTEKWTLISQSQDVREMFYARFDGCSVL